MGLVQRIKTDLAIGAIVETKVEYWYDSDRVLEIAARANYRGFVQAAEELQKAARARLIRSRKRSAPDQPPRSLTGRLKRSIGYHIAPQIGRPYSELDPLIVGPRISYIQLIGHVHEFGGRYKGADYPRRPFMGPTLRDKQSGLVKHWQSSFS
jgi:phage gpG-like protein